MRAALVVAVLLALCVMFIRHMLQSVIVSLRAVPVAWGSLTAAAVKIGENSTASPRNGRVEFSGKLLAKGKDLVSVVASFPQQHELTQGNRCRRDVQ